MRASWKRDAQIPSLLPSAASEHAPMTCYDVGPDWPLLMDRCAPRGTKIGSGMTWIPIPEIYFGKREKSKKSHFLYIMSDPPLTFSFFLTTTAGRSRRPLPETVSAVSVAHGVLEISQKQKRGSVWPPPIVLYSYPCLFFLKTLFWPRKIGSPPL